MSLPKRKLSLTASLPEKKMGSSFLIICKLAFSIFPSLAPPSALTAVTVKFSVSSGILDKTVIHIKKKTQLKTEECKPSIEQSYLIRCGEESEVLEIFSVLEGDRSLDGADISRERRLHHPGNKHFSKEASFPHDGVHCCKLYTKVIY